jgi:two-component system NtrC family sensor kinase
VVSLPFIDSLRDPVFVCDAQLNCTHANPAFLEMFLSTSVLPDLASHEVLGAALAGTPQRVVSKCPDGAKISIFLWPNGSGGVQGLVRSQNEEVIDSSLEEAYGELESLVDRRTAQLQKSHDLIRLELVERIRAQGELEEAHRQLSENQVHLVHAEKMASLGQMVAGISHELNSPLGFVASNLTVLKRYVDDLTTLVGEYEKLPGNEVTRRLERESDMAYVINDAPQLISESREGINRVVEMIRGLKGYSRRELGTLQDADINALINSALRILSYEIKGAKVRVNHCAGIVPRIPCYPGQLSQVFINLVVNAVQASEAEGVVEIFSYGDDSSVSVTVANSGIGILESDLGSVFEPFFTTKESTGTGLGLAISKSIVDLHGGTLSVVSSDNEGTVFTMCLPIDPDSQH